MRRPGRENGESQRKISRRALMLGGAQAAVVAALGLRMRYMQVEEAKQYRMLADENRINIRLIPPARGLIFDRNGILLAGNEQNYSVVIVREDAGDVPAVLNQLSELIPLSQDEIDLLNFEVFPPVKTDHDIEGIPGKGDRLGIQSQLHRGPADQRSLVEVRADGGGDPPAVWGIHHSPSLLRARAKSSLR